MKNADMQFGLPVTFLKEGDNFIAYTPALDLSTFGPTFDKAKKNFVEVVNIFFEGCVGLRQTDTLHILRTGIN